MVSADLLVLCAAGIPKSFGDAITIALLRRGTFYLVVSALAEATLAFK